MATGLVAVLAGLDVIVLAPCIFRFHELYASRELWIWISMVAMPRLLTGLAAGLVAGVFTGRAWRIAAFIGYAVFLAWSFDRYEVYVEWLSIHAVAFAAAPYVSGVLGLATGFIISDRVRRSTTVVRTRRTA